MLFFMWHIPLAIAHSKQQQQQTKKPKKPTCSLYHKYSEYLQCAEDCTDELNKALALCSCFMMSERHSKTYSIADDAMHYGETYSK